MSRNNFDADEYTDKELEMMETRLAEQELELVELKDKISKMESGRPLSRAVDLLKKFWRRNQYRSYYLPKDFESELIDFLNEMDELYE